MNGPGSTRTTRTLALIALVAITTHCASNTKPATDVPPADPRSNSHSDSSIEPHKTRQSYATIAEYIQGHAPGVQVIHMTDGSFGLRIRGMSSPEGINDPLIVIDGAMSGQPGTRALDGLNPEDVVKIEVLKDAASTAAYGLRGGSGVILITTRKK